MFEALATRLEGPVLVKPRVFGDERGFFHESYRRSALTELGVAEEFVQDNHSRSVRGIVRGMHFQQGMGKLVRCTRGAVLDVLVDIRRGSPSFGQWEAFRLDDESLHSLYAPPGFGHGFCVLSDVADVVYKCTTYYDPELEGGFHYADPEVGIEWPEGLDLIASERDAGAPRLLDVADRVPFEYRA